MTLKRSGSRLCQQSAATSDFCLCSRCPEDPGCSCSRRRGSGQLCATTYFEETSDHRTQAAGSAFDWRNRRPMPPTIMPQTGMSPLRQLQILHSPPSPHVSAVSTSRRLRAVEVCKVRSRGALEAFRRVLSTSTAPPPLQSRWRERRG